LLAIALRQIVVIEAELTEAEETTEIRDQAITEEENEEFAFNGKMVTADMVIDVDSPTKKEAETEVDLVVVVIKEADPDLTVEAEAPEGQEDPDPQSNQDLQKNPDLEIIRKADPRIEVTREKSPKRKEVEVTARVIKKTGDRAGLFD